MGRGLGQPFQRKDKAGWWFRWTDPATKKRIHRWFPNKGIADNFRSVLLHRRFADCIPGGIPQTIEAAATEYLATYDVRGCRKSAQTEARLTLEKFKKSILLPKTSAITQKSVDAFVVGRLGSGASRWTVNKDIGNLHAFLAWCTKQRYIVGELSLKKVKVEKQVKKSLTTEQIQALLAACETPEWRVRILLSLTTGLRKNDLDSLPASAVDLKKMVLDMRAQKTGKVFINLPLPDKLRPILRKYLSGNSGQLFQDTNVRKAWYALRIRAKLPEVTRQDLRMTNSTFMQRIGSIGSAKTLLQHSSIRTTGEFYTDDEVVMRWKINQLPVAEWLRSPKKPKKSQPE